jgi:adenine-specific DNA-methyltransferase
MITKSHRLGRASRRIVVTTSFGQDLQGDIERSEIPRESIIDDSSGDGVIRIPGDSDDRDVMELVESLPMRFMDTGLCISTGPVVMFRATDYLVFDSGGKMSVPLLLPHNIKPFTTVWPVAKNGKPTALSVCEESRRLLLPVKNYVILKRFTAKEEKRRLTAGCLLREKSEFSEIAIENHLNYVYHADRELSDDETFGIAALFNSTMLDRYFRTISGNTQVNATEIRTMPFPDLKALRRIGKRVKHRTSESESLVLEELGVGEALRDCLVSN